jgi:hypothetical protein
VHGTIHRQKDYRVDFYLLHTGHSEWDFVLSPKQDGALIRYRKLSRPIDVLTCVDCYARPEIRRLLDDDFAGRREVVEVNSKA